jgi:uncharacterized protein YndB with AHSA1/START domain
MSEHSITHATFTIERTLKATPEKVFEAISKPDIKVRWFIGPNRQQSNDYTFDFRVGGREYTGGHVSEDGPTYHYEAVYQDIVPNERVIYSYEMYLNDARISVSLASIELQAEGDKTHFLLTEQGMYLDGADDSEQRERGTRDLMDQLQQLVESV